MSNRHQNSMSLMERSRRSLVSPDGCAAAAARTAETARLLRAAARGQNVISHGPDGTLGVDEIGGIRLVADAAAAEA